jgi:hypothetical protein
VTADSNLNRAWVSAREQFRIKTHWTIQECTNDAAHFAGSRTSTESFVLEPSVVTTWHRCC